MGARRLILLTMLLVTSSWSIACADGTGGTDTTGSPAPSPASNSPSSELSVRLERIPGSFSQPLYVAAPPEDASRLFVVEKTGAVRIVKDGSLLDEPFLDLTGAVSRGREQGLLSIAFDPAFADTRRFYVNYTDQDGTTRIVRYTASSGNPDKADERSREELLAVPQPYANHNGGQLQFGPDGRLYVGTGDGGGAGDPEGRAQDTDSLLGKILRFAPGAPARDVEIYALGLRNPWRFSFDRQTGALWIADVGQNEREEVSYLPAEAAPGANFGWNGYEGSQSYDAATARSLDRDELIWPVAEYGRDLGGSITGGYVYRGSDIPALRGHYVFADFVSGRAWVMNGPDDEPMTLDGLDRRLDSISSFGEDERGELYVVSLEGAVYGLAPP